MKNFIAIDFETANRNRHSICAAGIVFVKEGKIVDSIYQLINPEESFDKINIAIHNITPKDLRDAPTFDVFYKSIRDKIDNQLIIAHNVSFDGYALRDNLNRYKIQPGNHPLLCTYQLSKGLLIGKTSYSLNSLCKHYDIPLRNHHHALDDARACAELMLKLIEEFDLTELDSLITKTGIKPRVINDLNISTWKRVEKLDLSAIEVSLEADPNNPFFQKNIVFTGKLNYFSRKDAAQLVADKGGKPQNGINKETNYIVLGNFDDVLIKGNKSTKLQKAEKMISEGIELEIISEEDFMKML